MSARQYSEEDCIEALREADGKVDGYLTKRQYQNKFNQPSVRTIGRIFGSWSKGKEVAGLEVKKAPTLGAVPANRDYTKEEWERLSSRRRKRERKKSYLAGLKMDRGCQECGYNNNPVALTFHHTNPEEKHEKLGSRTMDELPWDLLDDEVEKCVVLCSNCHFIHEWDDKKWDFDEVSTEKPERRDLSSS
jgi:hypothetical protein